MFFEEVSDADLAEMAGFLGEDTVVQSGEVSELLVADVLDEVNVRQEMEVQPKPKPGCSRDFSGSDEVGPSMENVRIFCNSQRKINTTKSTERDVKTLSNWLATEKFELRNLEVVPPRELNEYLAQYFVYIRKKDGTDYQPGSLTSMFHSVDRYLRDMKYFTPENRINIMKDDTFEDARLALHSKRLQLKKQGLGNRPNRSVAVDEEEERVMWEKGVLGVGSPFALQFTLWFHLTLLMGLRGRDEHRSMRWGDLKIQKTGEGKEFLEFAERASKTRDGSSYDDHRQTTPKVFCACDTLGSDKCVVEIFKKFKGHRPVDFCYDDAPFYLQYKTDEHIAKAGDNVWYKQQPIGVCSIGKMLPRACSLAGLRVRGNHGVRATTVQRLRGASVPDDKIVQITGHRSVRTLACYDTDQLAHKEHEDYQGILQGKHDFAGSSNTTSVSASDGFAVVPVATTAVPTSTNTTIATKSDGKSIFAGAVFNSCVFNVNLPQQ
jgi:hypothetical protein